MAIYGPKCHATTRTEWPSSTLTDTLVHRHIYQVLTRMYNT